MNQATTAEVAAPGQAEAQLSPHEAAIKAAEALMNEPGQGVDPEVTVAPQDAPTKPELPKSEDDEAKEARLAVVLRAKRQAAEIREKAQAEASTLAKELEQARSEAQRLQQEYRQLAPLKDALSILQTDPMSGLQKLGIDPRAFFNKALEKPQALDPVTSVERKLSAEVESLKKLIQDDLTSRQEREKQAQLAAEQQQSQQIATQFVQHVTSSASKFPTIARLYEDNYSELVQKADRVGVEYHAQTGQHATWDDICEYLEVEEAKRIARVTAPREQAASKESPPAARAKGKSPISTTGAGSSKATTSKPFNQMTPEEQREYAIEQANKAMLAAKGG